MVVGRVGGWAVAVYTGAALGVWGLPAAAVPVLAGTVTLAAIRWALIGIGAALLLIWAPLFGLSASVSHVARVVGLLTLGLVAFGGMFAGLPLRTALVRRASIRPPLLVARMFVPFGFAATATALGSRASIEEVASLWLGAAGLLFLEVVARHLSPKSVTVAAILGLYVTIAAAPLFGEAATTTRLSGLFHNPNSLGAIASFVATFNGHRAYSVRGSSWRRWAPVVSPALLVVLSSSRSASLALLAGIFVGGLQRAGQKKSASVARAVAAGGLLAGIAWAAASAPLSTVETRVIASESAIGLLRAGDSRTQHWRAAIEEWSGSPLIGVGLGESQSVASNSVLFVLAETGVVGATGALAGLVLAFRWLRRRGGTATTWALLAAGAISSLFESWVWAPASPITWTFWLLVVCSRRRLDR